MSNISLFLIDQVSASVSPTMSSSISAFHTRIRSLIGSRYNTFLQGSYANDTAISKIDDVDIVALKKPSISLILGLSPIPVNPFIEIKSMLESDLTYRGHVSVGRKCLTLSLATLKADIVPAKNYSGRVNSVGEPIEIAMGILNYPKTHINYGRSKNINTNNNYKKIVRMIKNFANNWNLRSIAPSYYLECLIYSYEDRVFQNDLPLSLYRILAHMISSGFNPKFKTIPGDKNVISTSEWNANDFIAFRSIVSNKLPFLSVAITTTDNSVADRNFKLFYNI